MSAAAHTPMRRHNFYKFRCEIAGQRRYYASCQLVLQRISNGEHDARYAHCGQAVENGSCIAQKMLAKEFEAGKTLYYIDRDDAGPGVMKRDGTYEPSPPSYYRDAPKGLVAKMTKAQIEKVKSYDGPIASGDRSLPAVNPLDLGALINDELGSAR